MTRRRYRIILPVFIAGVLAFSAVATWFAISFRSVPKTPPRIVVMDIERGQNASEITRRLLDQGLIRHTVPFLWNYRLFFRGQSLKAGEYTLQAPLSPRDILIMLTEGRVTLHPLTIPEGLTRIETADLLQQDYGIDRTLFLKASAGAEPIETLDPDAPDLEGYLFPETYHFPKNTSPEHIVSSMVQEFAAVFTDAWRKRCEEIGFTIRECVILASLIEKETSLSEEKAVVSAVFHNRLRIGMKLDCDPTIIYALKQEGRFRGRLLIRDLSLDSPYNTYRFAGLPPGPIANPGRDSLFAALYPADVRYLYFVSRNDGSHHFSLTFKEHQNAVIRYRRSKR